MASSDRLSWSARIGYGLGDYGLVLCWQLAGLFLLFFMTEVLGIAPAVAGLILLVGLVFDGVTDVAMGVIADKARTRMGGYRPWLLIGAPFLAGATALLFSTPPLQGAALIFAVVLAQLMFRLGYTIVAIPYGALSSAMTRDSRERSLIVGIRLTLSTSAALTIAVCVPPLVAAFGGGDQARGFFLAAAMIGAAAACFIAIAYFSARPPAAPAEAYRIADLPRAVFGNNAFLRVAGCIMCFSMAQALVLTGAPYFFSYVRGEPETLGLSLAVLIGGVAIFIPVWTVISRRIGKRATWIVGALWSGASLVGLSQLTSAPLPFFMTAMAFAAFGFAAVTLTSFAMLPDTVEYGEWKSGVRVEAALFSALTLSQKSAAGVSAALSGLLLSHVGHTQSAPMSGDGAALFGQALFFLPALLITLSLCVVWGYPITTAFHAKLVEELRARRAA